LTQADSRCLSLDLFDLTGKTALVTGGSRGLGRAMVLGFAAAGADVVIASRKVENCETLAQDVRERFGREGMPYACHVGNWDQLEKLTDAAYDRFDNIDILVNNAGMSPIYDKLTDISEALWDKVLDVNLKGSFRLSTLVGSRMTAGQGGSIINISSMAAVEETADVIPYSAAKAGLNAMTMGFANAYGPKVRVNCIQAGPFKTDISKAWDAELFARQEQGFAAGRAGEPEEVVGAALYFASAASSYCTGAVLALDGGRPRGASCYEPHQW